MEALPGCPGHHHHIAPSQPHGRRRNILCVACRRQPFGLECTADENTQHYMHTMTEACQPVCKANVMQKWQGITRSTMTSACTCLYTEAVVRWQLGATGCSTPTAKQEDGIAAKADGH